MLNILKPLSTSPSFNLAWEEYILKHIYNGNDLFLLWHNEKSIIVGRNQNPYQEVNLTYLDNQKIPLFRRISGGGTVYHDLGNLNYTFITNANKKVNNYELMTKPIIDSLNKLGIKAYFSPKSDMKLNNYKIGGNAQFLYKNILLHHGTILYDTNLESLKESLQISKSHSSKSVKSRPSSVININQFTKLTFSELVDFLYEDIAPNANLITLSDYDLKAIKALEKDKYLTKEWNYFESPNATFFEAKNNYKISFEIKKGLIKNSVIEYGNVSLPLIASLLNDKMPTPQELAFLKNDYSEIYNLIF